MSATNLNQPVAWTPATNAAVLSNQWRLTLTLPAAGNGARFYRLQVP